jgi:hypothetical protein
MSNDFSENYTELTGTIYKSDNEFWNVKKFRHKNNQYALL